MKIVNGRPVVELKDYTPKGTDAQEEAFEEWYTKPEASEGFCRKTAFLRGWEAAIFEMCRDLQRLQADNRALRDALRLPRLDYEPGWERYIDELAAEIESLGAETAALHYATAVANWNEAMDQRDVAETALVKDVAHVEIDVD
jgi:hypothetical protein